MINHIIVMVPYCNNMIDRHTGLCYEGFTLRNTFLVFPGRRFAF